MMWLNSKVSGGHRSSLLKRILFFLVILCFLAAFNFVFVGDATEPEPEDGEHPWDDFFNTNWNSSPSDSTGTDDLLTFPFGAGFGSGIIFHFHMGSAGQDGGLEKGKVFGPASKSRGYLFIFIK